jgi:hypothetical protein
LGLAGLFGFALLHGCALGALFSRPFFWICDRDLRHSDLLTLPDLLDAARAVLVGVPATLSVVDDPTVEGAPQDLGR